MEVFAAAGFVFDSFNYIIVIIIMFRFVGLRTLCLAYAVLDDADYKEVSQLQLQFRFFDNHEYLLIRLLVE